MEFNKAPIAPNPEPKIKRKHRVLKALGIILVLFFLITYFVSYVVTSQYEKGQKQLFLSTNANYTGQDITLDKVSYNVNSLQTVVHRIKVYNPPGYISPYSISIGEVALISQSEIQVSGKYSEVQFTISPVELRNVNINYDINSGRQVNLHAILDNIMKSIPNHGSEADFKFKLHNIVIERPTINIYSNRTMVKTIEIPNIIINFDSTKNITYLEALSKVSLKLVETIDKAVLK